MISNLDRSKILYVKKIPCSDVLSVCVPVQYQLDVETLSESLSELNSSLKKVEGTTGKSGSAMTLQLEVREDIVY